MEFLLLGGSGQVGIELRRLAWPQAGRLIAPSRQDVDLENPVSIREIVAARPWAAVINCAAYTAVDRAETERDRAWQINAVAPQVLAAATAAREIPLIQISTDYVFDGRKREPYVEDDPIAPLNVYGESKAEGERAVRTENQKHVIVRTSWVFSAHGTNFVKTMLRLGRERPALRIVADQHGCPTAAGDLAQRAPDDRAEARGQPQRPLTARFTCAMPSRRPGTTSLPRSSRRPRKPEHAHPRLSRSRRRTIRPPPAAQSIRPSTAAGRVVFTE